MATTVSEKLSLFIDALLLQGGPKHFSIDGEEEVDVRQLFDKAIGIIKFKEEQQVQLLQKVSAPSSPASPAKAASSKPESQGLSTADKKTGTTAHQG